MNYTATPIPLSLIDPPAFNPRSNFNPEALRELQDSIAAQGLIHPVSLLRQSGGRFELICGERRLRAFQALKRDTIPAFVRADLDEKQILSLRMAENLDRDQLSPLEESGGFQYMLDHGFQTVDEIAASLQCSRAKIYGRLKLLSLPDFVKQPLGAGVIDPSIALLIARIPDPDAQKEAAERILQTNYQDAEPLSYRSAVRIIHEEYMIRLKDAPFDPEDKTLPPASSSDTHSLSPIACSKCPHRTGNLKKLGLLPDLKATDICTNPRCFHAKAEATAERKAKQLQAKGAVLLEDAASQQLFPNSWAPTVLVPHAGYVDLHAPVPFDAKGTLTWKKALAKLPKDHQPSTYIARDGAGEIRELLQRGPAFDAAIQAGFKQAAEFNRPLQAGQNADEKRRQAAERKQREAARAQHRAAAAHLVNHLEADGPPRGFWRAACELATNLAAIPALAEVLKRRDHRPKSRDIPGEFLKYTMLLKSEPEFMALTLEMLLCHTKYGYPRPLPELEPLLSLTGFDPKSVES